MSSSRFTVPVPVIVMKSSTPLRSRFVSSVSTVPVADRDENAAPGALRLETASLRARARAPQLVPVDA